MYVCMHVCMYVCIYIYIHIHNFIVLLLYKQQILPVESAMAFSELSLESDGNCATSHIENSVIAGK